MIQASHTDKLRPMGRYDDMKQGMHYSIKNISVLWSAAVDDQFVLVYLVPGESNYESPGAEVAGDAPNIRLKISRVEAGMSGQWIGAQGRIPALFVGAMQRNNDPLLREIPEEIRRKRSAQVLFLENDIESIYIDDDKGASLLVYPPAALKGRANQ